MFNFYWSGLKVQSSQSFHCNLFNFISKVHLTEAIDNSNYSLIKWLN